MTDIFDDHGPDWRNKAMLHYMPQESSWNAYLLGYKEAADRLVRSIQDGQHGQDYLVYPILFLYRHWIEISLKALIQQCQLLAGIERPEQKRKMNPQERAERAQGHDLIALWGYLQSIVPQIYPAFETDADLIDGLSVAVAAFSHHDSSGDGARYPRALSGETTWKATTEINLRALAEHMAHAATGIYQIEGVLDYELQERSLSFTYENQFDSQYE
ncbi:hypothetical protein VDR70_015815 [Xanthomonas campestris pv. campestris]|uniref:hypothetical protein n=1 Tax=Xanthomonas campestris TaxID=339 RepID=UPI001E28CEA1|nr:hypothetical protein [Xanthomonas campestris]MCC5074254.1 hypothetical protein [Xanthomonas campestris pv. plantaginis]MCF8839718.1 hypothetical protein [Xanthomonas campestris pv. campestris]MDM7676552.1 hypothetical protein [Xanthomonas campestris pv. campestris]MDM7681121.1 hypothetical protein [Xanthomonas campestris pv. campestris]MDM7702107.1 hypothetical protein [Xanthomonas campestris pv. campestris]